MSNHTVVIAIFNDEGSADTAAASLSETHLVSDEAVEEARTAAVAGEP